MSKSNPQEAQFTMMLIEAFCYLCSCDLQTFKNKIAVITPYKGQARRLVSEFDKLRRKLGCDSRDIAINTVDAFQGQERDIVIFNCVRSNKHGSIGFLKDLRRLNVAITRPKHFLFVIGNSQTLRGDKLWKAMIEGCQTQEGGYFK